MKNELDNNQPTNIEEEADLDQLNLGKDKLLLRKTISEYLQ